jgi:hypothetical protein
MRIHTDIYEKIEMETVSKDASVSAIINGILRKYVTWDQFVNAILDTKRYGFQFQIFQLE